MSMNRTSSILLWVVLTIGAIVLSSIYLFGQSQLSKPASSLTVNRPSVAPVNTEFTSTPATPTISVPSESVQNPNPTSNPELSLATSSSPVVAGSLTQTRSSVSVSAVPTRFKYGRADILSPTKIWNSKMLPISMAWMCWILNSECSISASLSPKRDFR